MFQELIDDEMEERSEKVGIGLIDYEITGTYFAGPDLEITGNIRFTGEPDENKFSKSKSLVLYGDGTFYFNTTDPEIIEAYNRRVIAYAVKRWSAGRRWEILRYFLSLDAAEIYKQELEAKDNSGGLIEYKVEEIEIEP